MTIDYPADFTANRHSDLFYKNYVGRYWITTCNKEFSICATISYLSSKFLLYKSDKDLKKNNKEKTAQSY